MKIQLTETEIANLTEFAEKELKVNFKNLSLLHGALIHRSYLNEVRTTGIEHNERLEFLGDAVLELIATEFLFEEYPNRPEGELTSFRAALVRTESLAETATKLNYGQYIYMSKGEEKTGGRERPYILANTFEAVLGAIFLDQGIETCREFVRNNLLCKTKQIVEQRLDVDAKSKFQEIAQELLKETPTYKLLTEEGPDHDKIFTMSAMVGEMDFGTGSGASKQEAEQEAASNALKNWKSMYQKYTNSGKITTL